MLGSERRSMASSQTPPPLRRRSRPPRRPEKAPAAPLSLAPLVSHDDEPPADTLDPTEGEWLFKKDEVVLGPIPAGVLLERIEAGEIGLDTPVGRQAGAWRPLRDIPHFVEVYEAAAEQRRREEEARVFEARVRRAKTMRVLAMASTALVPFVIGLVLGYALMVKRPWDDSEKWLMRPPPLVDLPPRPRPSPAQAARAEPLKPPPLEEQEEGERAASPEPKEREPKKVERPGESKRIKTARRKKRSSQEKRVAAARSEAKPEEKPPKEQKQPEERLNRTLTRAEVLGPISGAKSGIGQCLKAELKRNPDVPSVVTLAFTVTEEGQAINVRVKERQVGDGPLPGCLAKVLAKLRWPKFTGERQNIELPFQLKR